MIDLPRVTELCRFMLGCALDVFAKRDAEQAQAVAAMDDQVDNLYKQVFRELMSYIVGDPPTVTRALNLLFAGLDLERIGDCVTNTPNGSFTQDGAIGRVERTASNWVKTRVLFLCVHLSARSQIAEGLIRRIAGD